MTEVPDEEPVIILLISGKLTKLPKGYFSDIISRGLTPRILRSCSNSVPFMMSSGGVMLVDRDGHLMEILHQVFAFGTRRDGASLILGSGLKQMAVSLCI